MLTRICGLETEYAVRFATHSNGRPRPAASELFNEISRAVGQRVLTAPAARLKTGIFTANGGALWLEQNINATETGGLIEGSTPECRGPRQLLRYQRAQDRLLMDAVNAAFPDDDVALLKNDRDAAGNIYGAQENYEATLATGWRWIGWRLALVLSMPAAILTWALLLVDLLLMILIVLLHLSIGGVICCVARIWSTPERYNQLKKQVFLHDNDPLPAYVHAYVLWSTRLSLAPLALVLLLAVHLFAFRRLRQQLTPFLISRMVMTGAGSLNDQDQFELADKAGGINCQLGFGALVNDHPLYSFGHVLKLVYRLWDWRELFAPHQRLQISAGDSNLSQEAEFLRIGSTMLVLDAIEAGKLPPVPQLRNPIAVMHRWNADSTLTACALDRGGQSWTALDVQKFYYQACRRFVEAQPDPSEEALEILRRWGEVLELLPQRRRELVGRLDWVTKQFLLEEAGAGLDFAARKKIDLRYHELSDEGYFQQFARTELVEPLLSAAEVEQAIRTPPGGTRAATRGRYIREFTGPGLSILSVNWHSLVLREGGRSRRIRLTDPEVAGCE